MDNASKALIMAGAILISVAIVGIGIYIFSAANSMTNDAVNTMESTQVAMFNNGFYQYGHSGDKILGTRAKELKAHADAQKVTCNVNIDEDRRYYEIGYVTDNATGYIKEVTLTKK